MVSSKSNLHHFVLSEEKTTSNPFRSDLLHGQISIVFTRNDIAILVRIHSFLHLRNQLFLVSATLLGGLGERDWRKVEEELEREWVRVRKMDKRER